MSFSLGETVCFSLLSRQCSTWHLPQWLLSCPTPVRVFSATCSASLPQAERKYSLRVFGRQFCPERMQSATQLCYNMWIPPKQCAVLTQWISRLAWLKMIRYGEGRQAANRVFVSACVWPVLVFPDACSGSLSVVFCSRVIVGEVADTLRQRGICASIQQSEVLCLHVLWQVQVLQVLACLCHSMFSALPTQSGGN
jgi:hypothetical protein